MAKKEEEEIKTPFMATDAIEESDIPKKGGREPAFDWSAVLAKVQPGKAQEVDPKLVSKGTLITAVKAYNADHDTAFRVVGRKVEENGKISERVWIRNPAPDESDEEEEEEEESTEE